MSAARLSIPAGLLVGIAVAVLVLGGIVMLAPDPVPAATPSPSAAAATPSPSVAAPSATVPSASPSGSTAPSASSSGSAGPGTSPVSGAFHVGEPAPALVVPQVRGGTIGVDVTP